MTSTVSARIDSDTKMRAEQIMAQLGLSHSQVINNLYSQIVLRRGLPFEIRLPDARGAHDIPSIKRLIFPLAEKYGLRRVSVFGSVARGEAKPGSDVDLLVSTGEGASLLDLGGFAQEAQAALGVPVDVATEEGASTRLKERIRREKVLLYEQ